VEVRRVLFPILGALEHQDVPFERLVDELAPDRSLARHPLVQVMVALQDNTHTAAALPGVRAARISAGTGAARFDLEVSLAAARGEGGPGGQSEPGGLRGQPTAAADQSEETTERAMADRLP